MIFIKEENIIATYVIKNSGHFQGGIYMSSLFTSKRNIHVDYVIIMQQWEAILQNMRNLFIKVWNLWSCINSS